MAYEREAAKILRKDISEVDTPEILDGTVVTYVRRPQGSIKPYRYAAVYILEKKLWYTTAARQGCTWSHDQFVRILADPDTLSVTVASGWDPVK